MSHTFIIINLMPFCGAIRAANCDLMSSTTCAGGSPSRGSGTFTPQLPAFVCLVFFLFVFGAYHIDITSQTTQAAIQKPRADCFNRLRRKKKVILFAAANVRKKINQLFESEPSKQANTGCDLSCKKERSHLSDEQET